MISSLTSLRVRRRFAIAAIAGTLVAPAFAQPSPARSPYPIDLPTALQLAGAQNLDLKLAREKLTEAKANRESVAWQFLPWVAPGLAYRRHDNLTQDVAGNIVNVHKDSYAYGPTLMAQFDFGDTLYKHLAAKQLVKAAEAGVEGQRQDSALAAAQGYFELVRTQSSVAVAEEALRIADTYARQLTQATEIGTAFKGDALRAEVQADRARTALRQAREQTAVAAARLRQLLHLDPEVELVARDAELLPIELIPKDSPREKLVAQAMASRPEINQTQSLIEAARDARAAAKYGPLLPSIGAQAFVGGFGGRRAGIADRAGRSDDYQLTVGWRIGPGGLLDHGRIGTAESRLRTADLTAQKVTDEIIRQVAESDEKMLSAADQIATTQHSAQMAQQAFDLTNERKDFAVGAVLENIQAEQDLTRTRLDYLVAVAEFDKAQYALARAIGTLGEREPIGATGRADATK